MSSSHDSVTFVGGGNMGAAIVSGLVRAGWSPDRVTVVERSAERRASLVDMYPGAHIIDSLGPCHSGVIAVKPGDAVETCAALALQGATRVLSIAAGISLTALQEAAGTDCHVVRAMPNTPALVGEGVAGISGSTACVEDDLVWAESILGAVGTVVRVEESLLDAVTAVSGSGPAYLFLFAEALVAAGIEQGLSPDVADALVRQLFVGSGRLLQQSLVSPAQLRAQVTSPNGVTAEAIATLEDADFRAIDAATVRSAVARSRELGR
jgi:pyrroline-5-carboxylate reductase